MGATLGVRQEALGVCQGDERAAQPLGTGEHPATMEVTHPVRPARAPEGELLQHIAAGDGDAGLAGGPSRKEFQGIAQPIPRSNWAVSNNGRPTTLE